MTKQFLTKDALLALTLDRNDKLDLRLGRDLKRALKKEWKPAGFTSLTDYVIAILASRPRRQEGGEE